MPERRRPSKHRRDQTIWVRLSPSEKIMAQEVAEAHEYGTVSEMIRDLIRAAHSNITPEQ